MPSPLHEQLLEISLIVWANVIFSLMTSGHKKLLNM